MQRLLEATLRFKLPYDAYQHRARVSLAMLTGRVETYDLHGDHLDEQAQATTRVFVESKNVDGAANQGAEFESFLAQAYSATKRVLEEMDLDPEYEFMWATTSPWKGEGFRKVASEDALRNAVERNIGGQLIPDDHEVDEALVRTVAQRLWVWVISDRQEDMTLSAEIRGWVMQRLAES